MGLSSIAGDDNVLASQLRSASDRLGEPRAAEARDRGRHLSIEDTVDYALTPETSVEAGGSQRSVGPPSFRLTARWRSQDGRWATASGKAVISAISKWSQENFGVGFGPEQVARTLRPDEIDPEVVEVVSAISQSRPFRAPYAMPK